MFGRLSVLPIKPNTLLLFMHAVLLLGLLVGCGANNYQNAASSSVSQPKKAVEIQSSPIAANTSRSGIRSTTHITEDLAVLYTFEEGSGTTISDTSNKGTPLNLSLVDEQTVQWIPGGLSILSPTLIASQQAPTDLMQTIQQANELTLEAWIKPLDDTQDGPARILTLSADTTNRNFTLGQGLWGDLPSSLYTVRVRTTETDANGVPALSTTSGTLTPELTHIVYTREASGTASLYLNGQEQAAMALKGDFSAWNTDYRLALANELTADRPWLGEYHLVAIYNRALSANEVRQNFMSGPGGATTYTPNHRHTASPITQTVVTVSSIVTPELHIETHDPTEYFPLGVFEDGNMFGGDAGVLRMVINDLTSHGLDSIMFTNNSSTRDAPMLEVSDELGFNVFFLPAGDWNKTWWAEEIPATEAAARQAAEPVVQHFHSHPSFKGYIVKDEPRKAAKEKVALMTRVLQELDPDRPAMPILIGTDRVGPIFQAAQPDVLLIDVYPAGYDNPIGDFTLTGFGYQNIDFVGYIRQVTQNKPATTPLWIILQTHKFGDGGPFSLREPTPAEVRAQNWLALGEGATGIFWFIYSSQQGWKGLVDNPPLYQEVTSLARRVAPLRETLLQLQKVEDQFEVEGESNRYISTLATADKTEWYVIVVNMDCIQSQTLAMYPSDFIGQQFDKSVQLRDMETSEIYGIGEPVLFAPGDGKMFEIVK
jgi:hypothetical protein